MTFSAVGTIGVATSSSFSLTPGGVGDFILAEVYNYANNTVTCTGMSSSNVTWAPLTASMAGTVNSQCSRVFIGTVTSTSPATVTVAWSGTAPGCVVGWQEFASTNGAASVALDGAQAALLDDGAGTVNWPSLTPAGDGELYWGYTGSFAYAAGATSGYVYQDDNNGQGMAYRLSCPAGVATAPVWGTGAQMVFGAVVLVTDMTGTDTSPAYAATATDLGGGTGAWSGAANATGAPDSTWATWTAP